MAPALPMRNITEAASWQLATDLVRRHPELTIIRYHPCDGQYDCLGIRSNNGLNIDLNRAGRIHVHTLEGGSGDPNWRPTEWVDYLAADPRDFVAKLEETVRLPRVSQTPSTTSQVLAYRLLNAIARLHLFSDPVDIAMSTLDSYGTGPAPWLEDYPEISRLIETDRADRYGFWRATSRTIDLVVAIPSATLHRPDGHQMHLAAAYDAANRNFTRFLGTILTETA